MNYPFIAKQQGAEGTVVSPSPSRGEVEVLRSKSNGDGDIASHIEQVLDQLRQNQIMVPQPAEVRSYLLHYADIIDLLPSVGKKAREYLGTQTQLSLELYRDPEIEDEYLTLHIRQKHYAPNILEVIENVSSEFDVELAEKSGWLLITTDFDSPR
jgi:hypothetical protein